MSGFLKIEKSIIKKDKITGARIDVYEYPVLNQNSSRIITPVNYRKVSILDITFEAGEEFITYSYFNNKDFLTLYPKFIDVYDTCVDDIYNIPSGDIEDMVGFPFRYVAACIDFIHKVGCGLIYTNQDLNEILNSIG